MTDRPDDAETKVRCINLGPKSFQPPTLLKHGGTKMTELSSTCEAIMQTPSEERLVALLDQWSLQWTWRGRQRAIGAGAYERYCTLGLYAFGGNAPNVSKASSMKEACIAVNRFMRHRFPHGTWTSIAVLLNPRIGLHRDMQNMAGKLNHAITLGTFNGGRVWIEDEEGTSFHRNYYQKRQSS